MVTLFTAFIASSGFSTIVAWLLHRVDNQKKGEREASRQALSDGVRMLLYMQLESLSHELFRQGWATDEERKNIDNLYSAYHALGGNGVGTALHERVMSLPFSKNVK